MCFVSSAPAPIDWYAYKKSHFANINNIQLQYLGPAQISSIFMEYTNEVLFAYDATPNNPIMLYNIDGRPLEWNQVTSGFIQDCKTTSTNDMVCLIAYLDGNGKFKYVVMLLNAGATKMNYLDWKFFSIKQNSFDVAKYFGTQKLFVDGETIFVCTL
jgi:hypothetical protein